MKYLEEIAKIELVFGSASFSDAPFDTHTMALPFINIPSDVYGSAYRI